MLRASAETSPIHFAPAYTARNNVKKAYRINDKKQCEVCGYGL
ncbi:hypothetical protein LTSEWAN_2265 [Salmonella enterica subsp. enterica serovar Wandsworth str. A4-580]|uniref:Uncharacterized protein n=2 Tax=Salmonella enterica I TaxID=59201 RepID=A0A0H3BRU2_SALNS|nr:hypothetical protein SNSL254_A1923 [Salmonella enterica subsp. enterica serovar Newport str. SL254]EHD03670.1 hypothetical protein LTSEWAN_2265 [Salmonella enterica subsp. enterica serovar Wandsworth str. A4-580]